jgi:hypothetical protein
MKLGARRFSMRPESRGALLRRNEGQWLEVQRAVGGVEDGLRAGCLPDPLAAMLIAQIEKRAALHPNLRVSHAR